MNVAIILAGGSGHRMQQDIPKQFLNIYDKPVIVYTLEGFQRHPEIDAIGVVCLDGWHEILRAYAKQFEIDKLQWIINGGETAQESIRNGVFHLRNICKPDDIVIIHDGIRPMVEDLVLSDVLIKCRKYGNLEYYFFDCCNKALGSYRCRYWNGIVKIVYICLV